MKKVYTVFIIVIISILPLVAWMLKRKPIEEIFQQGKTDGQKGDKNETLAENTRLEKDDSTAEPEENPPVDSMDENRHEASNTIQKRLSMTNSQVINLVALIAAPLATMVTAVIAFFALKESMLQRENMYRPELYIGETRFIADISDSTDIKYYPIIKDSLLKNRPVYTPYLRINNIGMGTALHVDGITIFSWELASPLLANLKMPPKKGKQALEDVYKRENDSLILFREPNGMRWKTDYIMPIAQTGEWHMEDIYVPSFKTLIKVSLWLMNIVDSPVMYFTIPLKMTYKDINEKWYTRKVEILINCSRSNKNKDELFITICSGQAHREYYNEMKKMM